MAKRLSRIERDIERLKEKISEFAAFLRSGALNAAPTVTPYHKQEDAADET